MPAESRKRKLDNTGGWRVKLYRLNVTGSWDDCGTGRISIENNDTLNVVSEMQNRILLRTKLCGNYQKQEENIIMWSEPNNNSMVELALSFQDKEGCQEIWNTISKSNMEDLVFEAAQQHHADILHQQQEGDDTTFDSFPHTPTLVNLEEIATAMDSLNRLSQREALASFIFNDDFDYWNKMLALFEPAEAKQEYGALATLAACVKSILYLNDPSILKFVVEKADKFESICCILEYDPDLREKANHRWFLQNLVRFRTIIPMENPDLINNIHQVFRINYLKDTLLRPTMDESSLSTLSSMQSFTMADIIKGVTESTNNQDSYLIRIIRILHNDHLNIQYEKTESNNSVSARMFRRMGCLRFLKELFHMVRISLQQLDKDAFFSDICCLFLDNDDAVSQNSQTVEVGSVASTIRSEADVQNINVLCLLADLLLDPKLETAEKNCILEILSSISLHDPALIRRHCIVYGKLGCRRPEPNKHQQVLYNMSSSNDLLTALLFLVLTETDAGVLLQVSEILRIVLDSDLMGDSSGPPNFENETMHQEAPGTYQTQFLDIFYEHYIEWLVAPFQYSILTLAKKTPDSQKILENFKAGNLEGIRVVPTCAIRTSFAVELLNFCVRAHLIRMKSYLLKSRTLSSVLNLLHPSHGDDRCLKLAAIRVLRAVLSVQDEAYHRHIIKHNLFDPVFAAFRLNPVGDNLIASAIVEMCDFIRDKEISSLLEHVVTKYLSNNEQELSLEDLSSPYVSTLTTLRTTYEESKKKAEEGPAAAAAPPQLTGKALEEQRKYQQMESEESYFDDDDDNSGTPRPTPPAAVDESNSAPPRVPPGVVDEGSDMPRSRRMFRLNQAPLLNHLEEAGTTAKPKEEQQAGNDESNNFNETTSW